MTLRFLSLVAAFVALSTPLLRAQEASSVLFNTAFEGASLARVERVSDNHHRVYLLGQQDARGRNRQATWVYFRMDRVRGRDLTVTLTGYLPGEYNDRPAPPTAAHVAPLQHFNDLLVAETQFDPSRPMRLTPPPPDAVDAPASWWRNYSVPYVLIESRIAMGRKLGARPTAEHRLQFGRELIATMAKAVE
jgi:hypothetical protein